MITSMPSSELGAVRVNKSLELLQTDLEKVRHEGSVVTKYLTRRVDEGSVAVVEAGGALASDNHFQASCFEDMLRADEVCRREGRLAAGIPAQAVALLPLLLSLARLQARRDCKETAA